MPPPAFIWPVPGHYALSGLFTDRRNYGQHNAIDIPAPTSTPVLASARGRVAFAGSAGSAGLAVFIDHPDGWRTHYCHHNFLRVTAGKDVRQGERIGDVGATGVADGPHLHFNLFALARPNVGPSAYVAWVGKWAVDPLRYLTKEEPDDMVIILSRPDYDGRWVLVDGVWKTPLSAGASAALDAAGPDTYRHVVHTKAQIDAIPNLPWYR